MVVVVVVVVVVILLLLLLHVIIIITTTTTTTTTNFYEQLYMTNYIFSCLCKITALNQNVANCQNTLSVLIMSAHNESILTWLYRHC